PTRERGRGRELARRRHRPWSPALSMAEGRLGFDRPNQLDFAIRLDPTHESRQLSCRGEERQRIDTQHDGECGSHSGGAHYRSEPNREFGAANLRIRYRPTIYARILRQPPCWHLDFAKHPRRHRLTDHLY